MFRLLSNIFYLAFGLAVLYVVYAIVVGDIDMTDKFMAIGQAVSGIFS